MTLYSASNSFNSITYTFYANSEKGARDKAQAKLGANLTGWLIVEHTTKEVTQ